MAKQAGFWSVEDRLVEISDRGDPLETLDATVDLEMFRPILERAARKSARRREGGLRWTWCSSSGCWSCRVCTG